MSDKYLEVVKEANGGRPGYAERRRATVAESQRHPDRSTGSTHARSVEARQLGLKRDLLDQSHPYTSSKAVKMMLAMGYEKGSGLGTRDDGTREPIAVKIKTGRGGLGLAEPKASREPDPESEQKTESRADHPSAPTPFLDFRRLKFNEQRDKRRLQSVNGILSNLGEVLPAEDTGRRPSTPTFDVLGSHNVDYVDVAEADDEAEAEPDLSTTLRSRLDLLRNKYHYCFWCGHQYSDQDDLRATCPGRAEEDHD